MVMSLSYPASEGVAHRGREEEAARAEDNDNDDDDDDYYDDDNDGFKGEEEKI